MSAASLSKGADHDTFVVRIWSIEGSDTPRGHIQHVRSRKGAHFASQQRLLRFIEEHLLSSAELTAPRSGPHQRCPRVQSSSGGPDGFRLRRDLSQSVLGQVKTDQDRCPS